MKLVTILTFLLCNQALAELSDQQKNEIRAMNWLPASGAKLSASKSSIVSLPGFNLIAGVEARRFREMVDGRGDPEQEADAVNTDTSSELIYEWFPEGFVNSDDWQDVDADSFLSQLRERDVEANKIRTEKGLATLTTTGWRQKPLLNRDTHTVSWAIEGENSAGGHVVNFVALKLGRYGIEKIIWVVDPADLGSRNDLLLAVNNHQYDSGARYTDYVAGTDHAAAYGVAGLVAGALGVKLLKVAGIGAALLGFKKLLFLLLVPFIFVWRKISAIFRQKPTQTASHIEPDA